MSGYSFILLGPLRIYGCKIYEAGALVRDFVPYLGYDYAAGTAIPGLRETGTGAFAPVLGGSGDNVPGYGGEIEGEQDAYIESNGSAGMSTGYKMKGAISRVEVDFRFVTAAAQKYIYGSSADSTLQTFLYTTGSGVGDSFKFCQRPYSNNGCDRQWVMTPDTKRQNSRVVPPFQESRRCFSPFQRNFFPCTALTFKPRIYSHQVCTWDSPVRKPRGKASWERLEGKP